MIPSHPHRDATAIRGLMDGRLSTSHLFLVQELRHQRCFLWRTPRACVRVHTHPSRGVYAVRCRVASSRGCTMWFEIEIETPGLGAGESATHVSQGAVARSGSGRCTVSARWKRNQSKKADAETETECSRTRGPKSETSQEAYLRIMSAPAEGLRGSRGEHIPSRT